MRRGSFLFVIAMPTPGMFVATINSIPAGCAHSAVAAIVAVNFLVRRPLLPRIRRLVFA